MKHSNISIFVPHVGCPHLCSFCDQRTISGAHHIPTGGEVAELCAKSLGEVKTPENTEIAFFGGSFTAIPRVYMTELLDAVQPFIGEGKFCGIRISTRPDCIDNEILELLKGYGVTSIELGAQSMMNHVLDMNDRGHSAEDVEKAGRLIRKYGFELGLQMMMGLYGSTVDDDFETIMKIADIKPDTVRIYPVVILKGTRLAELYKSGIYKPCSFDEIVENASRALMIFEKKGIRVIKCGLHASEFVEKDMTGGFYHPAFREICESRIYRNKMSEITSYEQSDLKQFEFAVASSCISKALGHKKSNVEYFRQYGIEIKIVGDENIPKYEVKLRR